MELPGKNWMEHVWAAIFMTVVVLSNTASADTFPVRKYEIYNSHSLEPRRLQVRELYSLIWLSKLMAGDISGNEPQDTPTLNDTLVSIQLNYDRSKFALRTTQNWLFHLQRMNILNASASRMDNLCHAFARH